MNKISIWDRATRAWHWLTVIAIIGMWWTAENHFMAVHITLGIFVVGLLIFRLCWGIWGSSTARFANFVKGPGAIAAYLKEMKSPDYKMHVGHNPLGALSVIALLAGISAQLLTGLFATDHDGLNSGPLAQFIDYDLSSQLAEIHHLTFSILLVLIGLHLVAIAFYLFVKKTNLIRPMISGSAKTDGTENAELRKPGIFAFLLSILIAGGIAALLYSLT